jgi:hypothetical protein
MMPRIEDGAPGGIPERLAHIDPCHSDHVNGAGGVSVLRMTDGVITNETLYYIAGGEPY